MAAPASSSADAKLDRLMQGMGNNPTPSATPDESPRSSMVPPAYARNAWNAIASKVSDINAQLRSDYSLLDHVETDLGQTWDQAVAAEQDVVNNWPFAHWYWAPGIFGDFAGQVLGPKGTGRVMAPFDDPDPDASPSPNPSDNN
nr:hypothetical protein [uncultured Rhodopila sp.]